jgi:methionyl-tRNA formyltransferase
MTRRVVFMGTPTFAATALATVVAAGHTVLAAYSQPPRPAGRGYQLTPSPVQQWAEAHGIPVRTPKSLKTPEEQAAFAALEADVAVVAAYGLLLPQPILDAPRWGCLNIHASLLPRWRGAAPIQRAIMAGDATTGITIMQMDAGLDTGPMLLRESLPILPDDTTATLHDRLAHCGGRLSVAALERLPELTPEPQDSTLATYASKISKDDARLDWQCPADVLERAVRAFAPVPGAWCVVNGERLKVLAARVEPQGRGAAAEGGEPPGTVLDAGLLVACGGGTALRLLRVQRPGKGPVAAEDFLRGHPVAAGCVFV